MTVITKITDIGTHKPPCEQKIRVAAGMSTRTALWGAERRAKLGVAPDQCGARADFRLDGVALCRPHAGASALAMLLDQPPPRTDEDEIARPKCLCPTATVRRVIKDGGTCHMGGCPYGGDF